MTSGICFLLGSPGSLQSERNSAMRHLTRVISCISSIVEPYWSNTAHRAWMNQDPFPSLRHEYLPENIRKVWRQLSKHCDISRYLPFVRGIHRSQVDYFHKGLPKMRQAFFCDDCIAKVTPPPPPKKTRKEEAKKVELRRKPVKSLDDPGPTNGLAPPGVYKSGCNVLNGVRVPYINVSRTVYEKL